MKVNRAVVRLIEIHTTEERAKPGSWGGRHVDWSKRNDYLLSHLVVVIVSIGGGGGSCCCCFLRATPTSLSFAGSGGLGRGGLWCRLGFGGCRGAVITVAVGGGDPSFVLDGVEPVVTMHVMRNC